MSRNATVHRCTREVTLTRNVRTKDPLRIVERPDAPRENASETALSLSAVTTSPVRTICNVPMKRLVSEESVQTLARCGEPVGITRYAKQFSIDRGVRVPTVTSADRMSSVNPIPNARKSAHPSPVIPRSFRLHAKRITIVTRPYDAMPAGSVAIPVPFRPRSYVTRTRSAHRDGTVQFASANMASLSMTMEN